MFYRKLPKILMYYYFAVVTGKHPDQKKEEDHMKANKIFNQTTITTVTTIREQVFLSGGLA